MKRAGFTMIELIFVIVILGILSAVALPKFIGVSDQAKAGKCKAFVGTLNRTVLPAIWSDAVLNNPNNISGQFTAANISAQIDVPTDCGTASEFAAAVDGNTTFTKTFGSNTYTVSEVTAPTASESPILKFAQN
jgi:prepilin-type N-terminal cleavage/methylation domain-containing protein